MEEEDVDIEAISPPSSSNEELLNIVDTVNDRKVQIRNLKDEVLSLRKKLKSVDKKEKKTIQESISTLESQITKIQQEIETEERQKAYMMAERETREKAERLRMKREERAMVEEERRREAALIAASMPQYSKIENENILRRLKEEGLLIHDISPDGNCLFQALTHQLILRHQHSKESINDSQLKLRNMAADYIEANSDRYGGFMEEGIEAYCSNLRYGAAWGGHLELDALSHALQTPIIVHQANSDPIKFGEEYGMAPLHILYRKHAYSLGEHYDSLVDFNDENIEIDLL